MKKINLTDVFELYSYVCSPLQYPHLTPKRLRRPSVSCHLTQGKLACSSTVWRWRFPLGPSGTRISRSRPTHTSPFRSTHLPHFSSPSGFWSKLFMKRRNQKETKGEKREEKRILPRVLGEDRRVFVFIELRTDKRQMMPQIMDSLMTMIVNAMKKEFSHYIAEAPHLIQSIREDFS